MPFPLTLNFDDDNNNYDNDDDHDDDDEGLVLVSPLGQATPS